MEISNQEPHWEEQAWMQEVVTANFTTGTACYKESGFFWYVSIPLGDQSYEMFNTNMKRE